MTDPRPGVFLGRLHRRIRGYGARRVVVALSGGVDSSLVLAVSARALGKGAVTAITAISPSYPRGELEVARDVSAWAGTTHRTVETAEVGKEAYARNDALRCFHCKMELYSTLRRIAEECTAGSGPAAVVLAGANADDPADMRPGLRAAERHGVRNPLLEEGMGKDVLRSLARSIGLPVANKPALACLSSRVAYGVRITPELLERIDSAERALRVLGFDTVRIRHRGERASIEVPAADLARLRAHPALGGFLDEVRGLGWSRVEIDPRGYRPGSLNEELLPVSGPER